MKKDALLATIADQLAEMNRIYRRPVFDEWALVALDPEEDRILHYEGPREESIREELADDLGALRSELQKAAHLPGQFEFSRTAEGTVADAFIAVGAKVYLICNHTRKTMQEITADPLWTAAQGPFVRLSERIAVSPLVS